MVAIELATLLTAARQAIVRAGFQLVVGKLRKPELAVLAAAFTRGCRDADAALLSRVGDAVSMQTGSQRDVADLVEVLVTAVVAGTVEPIASALTNASHPRLDAEFFDVEPSTWFTALAQSTERIVREDAARPGSAVFNWYQIVSTHATNVNLRQLLAIVEQDAAVLLEARAIELDAPTVPFPTTEIFRLPERLNPLTVGQEGTLREIAMGLQEHPICVLRGLGGVGKTQLAVRFAVEHRSDYDVVWGVRVGSAEQLDLSCSELGQKLGIVSAGAQLNDAHASVLSWLGLNDRWLLVFDAANEPHEIRRFLPDVMRGHVLITSTNPNWRFIGRARRVTELQREDSVAYLCSRAGRSDDPGADGLASTLGDLPLALEQAAAYCEQADIGFETYLQRYSDVSSQLLAQGPAPADHPLSVTATFMLALDGAQSLHPAASEFMQLCSVMARRPIPLDLLVEGAAALSDPLAAVLSSELECDALIAALRCFSLLERNDGDLVIHRLVQDVAAAGMAPDRTRALATAVAAALRRALPLDAWDPANWSPYQRVLDHVVKLGDSPFAQELADTAWLLDRVGTYLGSLRLDAKACELMSRAHWISSAVQGPEAPETLSYLNDLGVAYQRTDPVRACEILLQVVELYEAGSDCDGRRLAAALQNLGHVESDLGRPGAGDHLDAALAIYGREVPESEWYRDTAIAHLINNIGLQQWRQGELHAAYRSFVHAVRLHSRKHGAKHPEVARALRNTAVVQTELGQVLEALLTLDGVVAIEESTLGAEHPQLAVTLRERANTHRQVAGADLDLLRKSREDDMRARAIVEGMTDSPASEHALCLNSLGLDSLAIGDACRANGDPDEAGEQYRDAKVCFEAARELRENFFGTNHRDVVQSHNNIGRVELRLKDLAAAETTFRRSLTILARLETDAPVLRALAVDGLGEVAEQRTQWKAAHDRYSEAYELMARAQSHESPMARREAAKIERMHDKLRAPGG